MIAQLLSQWFPTIAPILIAAFLAWKEMKKPTPPKPTKEAATGEADEGEPLTLDFDLNVPHDMAMMQACQALGNGQPETADKFWALAKELKSAEAQTKK